VLTVVVKDPQSSVKDFVDQEQDEGGTAEMLFNNDFEPFAASGTAASALSDSDSEWPLLEES
jgi:hypothetical protein